MMQRRQTGFWVSLVIVGLLSASAQAGIVGYWTFNDGTCTDVSGGAHDGTLSGGGGSYSTDVPAGLPPGGRSIDLRGGDYYVLIGGDENDFDLGGSIGVSAWVKGWPGTWNPFIAKNGEENGWQFRRHGGDATLDWTTRGAGPDNGDCAGTSTVVGDGQWHHIAASFDGATKLIYVDGVLDRSQSAPGSITPSDQRLVLGARERPGPNYQSFGYGQLDDIVVYDHPLAPNQVAYLAAGGNPNTLPAAPAVMRWNFGVPDLQGWTVLNGAAYFNSGDGGGITPADAGGGFAQDGDHATFLMESPEFRLTGETVDGTNALLVVFAGGAGDQDGAGVRFHTPGEVLAFNAGNSNGDGQKALAFFNTATGQYDATIFENDNGGTNLRAFTLADLIAMGLDPSATYRLDYYENDEGGWGWGQLNSVQIAAAEPTGEIIPEPATMALLAMGALSLGGYVRGRRKA